MLSIFQDPIYVLENNIPIDAQHYLTNMLAKPLLRIFEPILGEAKAESTLLRGEHTRTKTVVTSKISALAGFTRKKQTCLGCKVCLTSYGMKNTKVYSSISQVPLPESSSNAAVCEHCKPRESEIYQKRIAEVRSICRLLSKGMEVKRTYRQGALRGP